MLSRYINFNNKNLIHAQLQHIFVGEILGAAFLSHKFHLNPVMLAKRITVSVDNATTYGQIIVDQRNGKLVNILDDLDQEAYYKHFANLLGDKIQSAVIGSFEEQKKQWSTPYYF